VLKELQIPTRGTFAGPLKSTYARVHCALFACRRGRMCLPSARSGVSGLIRRRCGHLTNYFEHLLFLLFISLISSLFFHFLLNPATSSCPFRSFLCLPQWFLNSLKTQPYLYLKQVYNIS